MRLILKWATALLIVLSGLRSYAQTNCTGKVMDATTHEPIARASVQIKQSNKGTITNTNGEFNLLLADTANELIISSLGYRPVTIHTGKQNALLVNLQSNNNSLQEIVISASRTAQKRSEAPVAIATISKQTMEDTKATRI